MIYLMNFFYFLVFAFLFIRRYSEIVAFAAPERGALMRQYLKLFAILAILSAITGSSYGQQPVTMPIGEHCIAYRYASEQKAAANAEADCQAAVAAQDCGIEDLNPPPGEQFVFTNAYQTNVSGYALPYVVWCQGYFAPPPSTPITVTIGANCIRYRYSSSEEANANDQADCQAAVAENDCGIEDIHVPYGYQFHYTNAYVVQDPNYVQQYLDVCQGVVQPQQYPKCVTGHTVPVSSASDCPGKCTLCGQYYCGWTVGGYCSGGSEQACQDPEEGSKIYCDCGTNLECNQTGPNSGPLTPKQ